MIKPRNIIITLICTTLLACDSSVNTEAVLASLKEREGKILIKIDGKEYYPKSSIFKGELTVLDGFFRTSLFDQFESNVVIAFGGEKWYETKPIKKQVFIDNQVAASVMIGKLINKEKQLGEGFLMTEGEITVMSISEEKFIMRFEGKLGKFDVQREPEKWNVVEGWVIIKKPSIVLQGLKTEQVYF
ncbi:MAG: hypothetical protein MUF45_00195 [Spirosomaceae bacterium]|jgi:hypothetical protein|nr:hypothetical protein [Spirosomataceae bacterium]